MFEDDKSCLESSQETQQSEVRPQVQKLKLFWLVKLLPGHSQPDPAPRGAPPAALPKVLNAACGLEQAGGQHSHSTWPLSTVSSPTQLWMQMGSLPTRKPDPWVTVASAIAEQGNRANGLPASEVQPMAFSTFRVQTMAQPDCRAQPKSPSRQKALYWPYLNMESNQQHHLVVEQTLTPCSARSNCRD